MADERLYDYLYVAEWDDFHSPPYTVTHKIKLNSGVNPLDFQKFMADDYFAQVGAVQTRIGGVSAQYLFTEASGPPTALEELPVDLSSFATRTSVSKYRCVASWRRTK
jgi:hypothetical protein